MLRYPCLVMDHDDTVVQSEKTIGYPFFCQILEQFRPSQTLTLAQFAQGCHELGFADMCRVRWNFTQQELDDEYYAWKDYVRTHIPDPFPGIGAVLQRHRAEGGLICVVSHSSRENITRDYQVHFGLEPDAIYGWDYPEHQRKPNPFPLHDIMRRYDLKPEQLLVVDDMKLAWQMAHPLGVEVAFAGWGRREFPAVYQEMTRLCPYTFDTPEDLGKFLFDSGKKL